MSQPAFARLSYEFAALSQQLSRVAAQLDEVQRTLPVAAPPPAAPYNPQYPYPYPYPVSAPPVAAAPPVAPAPPPRAAPAPAPAERAEDPQGWIGKVLAVAGVAVTLIGVVLLLVLAAQAGLLAPPVRVAAGAVLAAGLVAAAVVCNRRAGGRVGAIALAATGIAAGYMDVIAVTTIYHWVAPVAGLVIATLIGGGGLSLARRWDSQYLAVLVLVPLMVLAPIVSDGVTVLLLGFMLVLSAASLPVQLDRDWMLMHAARTVAVTVPLLLALLVASFGSDQNPWLVGGACGVAALLAVVGAVLLLPGTSHPVAMALITFTGVLPALSAAVAVDRVLAVLLAAAISAAMLALVLVRRRLLGITPAVAAIFAAVSAVALVVAVTVAFDGHVQAPVFLAVALVVAIAGRNSQLSRCAAVSFTFIGGLVFLGYVPPEHLASAFVQPVSEAVSVLAAGVLLIACAVVLYRSATAQWALVAGALASAAGVYAVTALTVTVGVLVGGPDGGFLAGHMAATICWIAMAAVFFLYAQRVADRDARTAPITAGLALTAAATAKLLLFDLSTLDGMFRVIVFIVVGLALLAMGAGYARSLAANGSADSQQRHASPIVTD